MLDDDSQVDQMISFDSQLSISRMVLLSMSDTLGHTNVDVRSKDSLEGIPIWKGTWVTHGIRRSLDQVARLFPTLGPVAWFATGLSDSPQRVSFRSQPG